MAQKKKTAARKKKKTGGGSSKRNIPRVPVRGRPFKIGKDSLGRSIVIDKRTGKRASPADTRAYRARLERERQARKRREQKRKAAGLPVRPKRRRKKRPAGPARGRAAIPQALRPLVRSLAPDVFTSWLVEYGPKDILGEDRGEATEMLASEILWKGELRTGDDFDFHTVREDEYGTNLGPERGIVTHDAVEESDHTMGAPVELDSDGQEVSLELTWPQAYDLAADMIEAMQEAAEEGSGARRADTGRRKSKYQQLQVNAPEERKEKPKKKTRNDGRDRFGRFVGKGSKPKKTGPARDSKGRFVSRKKGKK